MTVFEFVLGILFIVFGYKLIHSLLSYRANQQASSADSEDVQRLSEQLAKLDERIRVLERIVTDERYRLDEKFEELGD